MFFPSLLLLFRSPTGESSTAAAPSTSTTFPPTLFAKASPPSRPANKVIRFHFVSPLPPPFLSVSKPLSCLRPSVCVPTKEEHFFSGCPERRAGEKKEGGRGKIKGFAKKKLDMDGKSGERKDDCDGGGGPLHKWQRIGKKEGEERE